MPKPNQDAFDALIEGNLHATKNQLGEVKLHQLRDNLSVYLADFANEDVFGSLIGGYGSVVSFNEQMAKKREAFAKHKAQRNDDGDHTHDDRVL